MPNAALNYVEGNSQCFGALRGPPEFAEITDRKDRPTFASHSVAASDSYAKLKGKRAWDLAISPAKSLPMNAFMLYMSGGGVQIFSIGILAMLLVNPIKAVSTMELVFAPFKPSPSDEKKGDSLLLHKLVYIGFNVLTAALGLYKCSTMGLLPAGSADWLAFEARGISPERLL